MIEQTRRRAHAGDRHQAGVPGAGRVAGDDLPREPRPRRPRERPARALTDSERDAVLAELSSERFVDCSPAYAAPELLAERPNEVYSWDITKLKGPAKWTHFYLYVILDVFSRYAVGWTVQHRESGQVAKALIVHGDRHVCRRRSLDVGRARRGTGRSWGPTGAGRPGGQPGSAIRRARR